MSDGGLSVAFDPALGDMTDAATVAQPARAARLDTSVPVLLLGGKENALSIARHLGRQGIAVRASGHGGCWALHSRHCVEGFAIPRGMDAGAFWQELLLGPRSSRLNGHIVLPCSDDALEFVANHQDELARRYVLDGTPPGQRRDCLDKLRTLELARAAGVPTPRYWKIATPSDLAGLREARFPLMVKPVHSHKFSRVFGCKLFIVERDFSELEAKARLALDRGLDIVVVEMIPGPDDLLSSYYTYIDERGEPLFHFTKKVIRRYPANRGNTCYHATEWLPETAAMGLRFFQETGFRGLGNIEFKRDSRDGQLKIIEVNARFTAAQELLTRAGAPIDLIVYRHLTGQPIQRFADYAQDLRMWYPQRDFLAFLELRKSGRLGLGAWLASIAGRRHVLPLADLRDPGPSLGAATAAVAQFFRGRA